MAAAFEIGSRVRVNIEAFVPLSAERSVVQAHYDGAASYAAAALVATVTCVRSRGTIVVRFDADQDHLYRIDREHATRL
jgi:hypothetical protein